MNRVIRWYNQNRQIIWTVIAIVIGVNFLIKSVKLNILRHGGLDPPSQR